MEEMNILSLLKELEIIFRPIVLLPFPTSNLTGHTKFQVLSFPRTQSSKQHSLNPHDLPHGGIISLILDNPKAERKTHDG